MPKSPNTKTADSQNRTDEKNFFWYFCNLQGPTFQKNPLPSLFHFVRVLTAYQTHVGDILAEKYDFMMGNLNTYPFKIAKAVRKVKVKWLSESLSENDTYFLEIGPNVDAAFICMCAYAVDELFRD